jgi:predicted nucleic acid-binding protein
MRLDEALVGVTRLFLDTAPVIYFVEENPAFLPIVVPIFEGIERGDFRGVAGTVTLAECLVHPFRSGAIELQRGFMALLTEMDEIETVGLAVEDGVLAGELRAKYNLQLPDALQVATAIASGCEAFLTNDLALRRVTELRVLALTELEI